MMWDMWTVRKEKDGVDHYYEPITGSERRFQLACTRELLKLPAWFRSAEHNDSYYHIFRKMLDQDVQSQPYSPYPELNMCDGCLSLQIMEELSR